MANFLPPEGPVWNVIFWCVVGLLALLIADAVFYGLAPENHFDLSGS